MALINLDLTTSNSDGSTTIFGGQGNAMEELGSTGIAVYAAPQNPVAGTPDPIWYAPSETADYFSNLVDNPNLFETVAGGIKVFKMEAAMATWPDATLKAFFAYLSANNIKLGMETAALSAGVGQPGYGIEGFGAPGAMLAMVNRIQALGGTLSYVDWDEPYYYACLSSGLLTVSQVAAEAAASAAAVKAIFPNVQIGDIEPVGAAAGQAASLQTWFTAYAQASGSQFSSFEADTQTWSPGWQTQLAAVIAMARSNNISPGVVIDGLGGASTNDAWATQAVANAQIIMSNPSLRPDFLVVQSWQPYPSESADSNVAGSLASVAADVAAGESAALAVPAVAQYSLAGFLQSVTWTGGWVASESSSGVELLSPSGAIIQQTALVDVRNFSFNPNTGAVLLTAMVETAAPGATPVWQSESFSITVGPTTGGSTGFVTTTAPVSTTGPLTLALSAASQTGFAGSGITNQTQPTVSGIAVAGAVVALEVDGKSLGNVTASSTGAWSYKFSTALASGAHEVQASVTNASTGVVTQELYVVSVDTATTSAPTLTLAAGSDSGYPGDDMTDVVQPVFQGTAADSTLVNLTIDGTAVATVMTNLTGQWSYDLNTALAVGSHTVTATAVNAAGTASAPATMQLVIDTAAAEAAASSPDPLFDPAWYIQNHPGVGTTDAAAYAQFMATGWKEAYNPDPYFSVNYYLNTYPDVLAAHENPLTQYEQAGWQAGRNPAPGENTVAMEKTSPAGQDPLISYVQSFEYSDAVVTAVPNSTLSVGLLHDTGTSSTDDVTDDPTLAISADPGATLTLTLGSAAPTTFTLGSTGSWSWGYAAASLADGSYTVSVAEAVPGLASSTATLKFVLDRTAPTVTAVAATQTGTSALGVGAVATITLSMSETVLVTGSPTLTLNDGGVASYVSGSDSSTLTFAYTVLAGQNTTALAVTGTTVATGSSIDDVAGNAANLAGAVASLPGPIAVNTATTAVAGVASIGSGPDTLALNVSEDAAQGNAQYTVSVDGTPIGGVQTATVAHSTGLSQTLDVRGTFAAGKHVVSVNFLNGATGRNLYVTGASIDNSVISAATLSLHTQGAQSFSFMAGSAQPAAANAAAVTVSEPAHLTAGVQSITGTGAASNQSFFLDWSTGGVPSVSAAGWVQARVAATGAFAASVGIDPSGVRGTMYYHAGSAAAVAAWSATPV